MSTISQLRNTMSFKICTDNSHKSEVGVFFFDSSDDAEKFITETKKRFRSYEDRRLLERDEISTEEITWTKEGAPSSDRMPIRQLKEVVNGLPNQGIAFFHFFINGHLVQGRIDLDLTDDGENLYASFHVALSAADSAGLIEPDEEESSDI